MTKKYLIAVLSTTHDTLTEFLDLPENKGVYHRKELTVPFDKLEKRFFYWKNKRTQDKFKNRPRRGKDLQPRKARNG